jgi:hypothetical protein
MPNFLQRLFNSPLISHMRRNHALEHATIHIVSRRFPNSTFIGRSDSRGFFLFGDISTESLRDCIGEALARLRHGEKQLAALQERITTSSDPGPLEVVSVRCLSSGRPTMHRILTRS